MKLKDIKVGNCYARGPRRHLETKTAKKAWVLAIAPWQRCRNPFTKKDYFVEEGGGCQMICLAIQDSEEPSNWKPDLVTPGLILMSWEDYETL